MSIPSLEFPSRASSSYYLYVADGAPHPDATVNTKTGPSSPVLTTSEEDPNTANFFDINVSAQATAPPYSYLPKETSPYGLWAFNLPETGGQCNARQLIRVQDNSLTLDPMHAPLVPVISDAQAYTLLQVTRKTLRGLPLAGGMCELHYAAGATVEVAAAYKDFALDFTQLERVRPGVFQIAWMNGVTVKADPAVLARFCPRVGMAFWLALQAYLGTLELPLTGLYLVYDETQGIYQISLGLDLSDIPFGAFWSGVATGDNSAQPLIPITEYVQRAGLSGGIATRPLTDPAFDWANDLDEGFQREAGQGLRAGGGEQGDTWGLMAEILPDPEDIAMQARLEAFAGRAQVREGTFSVVDGEIHLSSTPQELEVFAASGSFGLRFDRRVAEEVLQAPVFGVSFELQQISDDGFSGVILIDGNYYATPQALEPVPVNLMIELTGPPFDAASLSPERLQEYVQAIAIRYIASIGQNVPTQGTARIDLDPALRRGSLTATGTADPSIIAPRAGLPNQDVHYVLHFDSFERTGLFSLENLEIPLIPGLTLRVTDLVSEYRVGKDAIEGDVTFQIATEQPRGQDVSTTFTGHVLYDLDNKQITVEDVRIPIDQGLRIDLALTGQEGQAIVIDKAILTGGFTYCLDPEHGAHVTPNHHKIQSTPDRPLTLSLRNPELRHKPAQSKDSPVSWWLFTDGLTLKSRGTIAAVLHPANRPREGAETAAVPKPANQPRAGTKDEAANLPKVAMAGFDLVILGMEPKPDGTTIYFQAESRIAASPENRTILKEGWDDPLPPAPLPYVEGKDPVVGLPKPLTFTPESLALEEAGLGEAFVNLITTAVPNIEEGHYIVDGIRLIPDATGQVKAGPLAFQVPEGVTMRVAIDIGQQTVRGLTGRSRTLNGRIQGITVSFSKPLAGPFELSGFHFDPVKGQFRIDALVTDSQTNPDSFLTREFNLNHALFKFLGFSEWELLALGINPKHVNSNAAVFLRLFSKYLEKRYMGSGEIRLDEDDRRKASGGVTFDRSHATLSGTVNRLAPNTVLEIGGFLIETGYTGNLPAGHEASTTNSFDFTYDLGTQRLVVENGHIGRIRVTMAAGQSFESGRPELILENGTVGRIVRTVGNAGTTVEVENTRFSQAAVRFNGPTHLIGNADERTGLDSLSDLKIDALRLVHQEFEDHEEIVLDDVRYEAHVNRMGVRFETGEQGPERKFAAVQIADSRVRGTAHVRLSRSLEVKDAGGRKISPHEVTRLTHATFEARSPRLTFEAITFSPGVTFTDAVTRDAHITAKLGKDRAFSIAGVSRWKMHGPSPEFTLDAGGALAGSNPHITFDEFSIGGELAQPAPGKPPLTGAAAIAADPGAYAKMVFHNGGLDVTTDPQAPLVLRYGGRGAFFRNDRFHASYRFHDTIKLSSLSFVLTDGKVQMRGFELADINVAVEGLSGDLSQPFPGFPEVLSVPFSQAKGTIAAERIKFIPGKFLVRGLDLDIADATQGARLEGDIAILPDRFILGDNTAGSVDITTDGDQLDTKIEFEAGDPTD